jgi:lysophospholipase L1-like esterase
MMIASILVLNGMCVAADLPTFEGAMPLRVTGPWSVEVGPGAVTKDGIEYKIVAPISFQIDPPEIIRVRDECHAALPMFDKDEGGWRKGDRLRDLIAEECTSTGLLYPDSVRLKPSGGDAPQFVLGTDYELDGFWATFGRTPQSAIAARQTVYVDYAYSPCRIDSIVVNRAGRARLAKGLPHVAIPRPPVPGDGEVAVINLWIPGRTEKLTEENLYPIEFAAEAPHMQPGPTQAERFLPKTLAKLRAGEQVTIVAFGDSVTDGGGVNHEPKLWYQNQFAVLLKERFPKANIRVITAGWGGANSKMYLEAPPGGIYDFVRDVLDPKPDLVTIEFVNDAYLDEAGTAAHYAGILERVRAVGAEVILITPHLVRPDWLTSDTLKVDQDPRAYVRGLRDFAAKNNVALADASKEWCRLWRRGLPYITLLANNINHPDERGHAIFAKTLIELFPRVGGPLPAKAAGGP